MAVESCWFQNVHGWATNETASWSHDVEFSPSSVLCTAIIASYSNSELSAASAGIIGYSTLDSHTGAVGIHLLPGISSPELVGITPAIFDNNVNSVSFYLNLDDADEGVIVMVVFQILFWG
jgi:hypothetical protein